MENLCGVDCSICGFKDTCKGCIKTDGKPFGHLCMAYGLCKNKGLKNSTSCKETIEKLKNKIIDELNTLNIKGMPKVETLFFYKGSIANIEYTLTNGAKVKFLDDNKIYLGTELKLESEAKYFGIAVDEEYICISQYENMGKNPKILLYKKYEL